MGRRLARPFKLSRLVVILHNIRSLHNVGSIFRTADAISADKIYLCGITPAPAGRFGKIRPQLAKVSLGAEKYVKWEKANTASKIIERLKSEGYKIFAIEQARNSIPFHKINLRPSQGLKLAVALGNEIKGLPPAILKKADKVLEIPMLGKKESLNVGVAFGIVAYFLRFGERIEK